MRTKREASQALFLGAYLLCLVDAFLFGYSTLGEQEFAQDLSLFLRICSAGFVLAKLMMDRFYSIKAIFRLLVVGLVFLLGFVLSHYNHLFYLLIICVGIRYVSLKSLVRLDFWMRLLLSLVILFLGLSGIIENYVTYRTNSTVYRYSLGFTHPNTVASLAFSLILEEAWLHKRRASPLYTICIWLLAVVLYLLTVNHTSVILIVIFPVGLALVRQKQDAPLRSTRGSILFASSYLITCVCCFAFMSLCKTQVLAGFLDVLLSNRFTNAARLYNEYGVSLLGQQVLLVSVKTARATKSSIALLDVAYLRMLIQGGLCATVVLTLFYGRAMFRAWKTRNDLLVLFFALMLLFGTCESGFNNVYMNFTLLFAAAEVYPKKRHHAHEPTDSINPTGSKGTVCRNQ